jgi:RecA/RadA recombinase
MKTKDIKKKLLSKKKQSKITGADYVSTGSTMLNLACTGRPNRGFAKGHYYFLVGDSASGKTFLSLTCLAEASINPNFDNYRFIYDNGEDGAMMDIKRFFGSRVAERLEPPGRAFAQSGPESPQYSSTIEEFYYHVDDALQKGKPFIYILDSMDSLSSKEEVEKFKETKDAYRKGKQVAGSYGDGKAKKNSQNIRRLLHQLRASGSILLIIGQTRDNLGFGFETKTRSGGKSLRFYACLEMWSAIKGKITKTVGNKKRQLGIYCQVQLKKNRITGQEHTVIVPIYHSYGIDDIGSCVDYLIEEGHWKGADKKIVAPEFNFEGSKEKLVQHIEQEDMEKDLKDIAGDVWRDIEEACGIKRKNRYE